MPRQLGGVSFTPQWNFVGENIQLYNSLNGEYILMDNGGNSYNYATPLAFNTPSLHDATVIETSSGMIDVNTIEQFYHLGSVDTVIYRRTANNALLDNWTSGVAVTGASGLFPYVFYDGLTRYMLTTSSDFKEVHLFTSANGTSWTAMNSGNPVLTASATSTDYDYLLFNVGACIVEEQIHILAEGNYGSGPTGGWLGYAVAPISAPVFTLSAQPVMAGGNAQLIYIPERNSIVALYSSVNPPDIRLKTATASLSNNLSKSGSWSTGFQLFPNLGTLTADADLVFTPGKTYGAIMFYSKEQAESYKTYTDLAPNTLQLYNSVAQYQPYIDPLLPITPNGINSTDEITVTQSDAADVLNQLTLNNGGGSNGGGVSLTMTDAGAEAKIEGVITGANENSGMALIFKTSPDQFGADEAMRLERDKSLTIQNIPAGNANDFVVTNSGRLEKRTAAQVAGDIGAAKLVGGNTFTGTQNVWDGSTYGLTLGYGSNYGSIHAKDIVTKTANNAALKVYGDGSTLLQGGTGVYIDVNGNNIFSIDTTNTYIGNTVNLSSVSTGTTSNDILTLDAGVVKKISGSSYQSQITFGTGVQAALGVNVGSAGAPVLFNGAGGTPSSITLTNATGTAASLNIGGNAATATALAAGRTIGTITGDATSAGSSFNGTANNTNAITVTKVNGVAFSGLSTGILKNTTGTGVPSIAVAADFPTLNQNTTGTAANSTLWAGIPYGGGYTSGTVSNVFAYNSTNSRAELITAGVLASFLSGQNINTTGSAATLTTTRTIWGQNFNGSANVSGAMSGVTTFSSTGKITVAVNTTNLASDISNTNSGGYGSFFSGGSTFAASRYNMRVMNYDQTIAAMDIYSDKAIFNGTVEATGFIKSGGTATQILMADGSVTATSAYAPISSVLWSRTSGVLNPINAGDKLEIVVNGINAINLQASTGTAANGLQVANGSGASYIFTEGSAGGTVTGSTAYATVIGAGANKDLQFMTNSIVRGSFTAAGDLSVINGINSSAAQTTVSGTSSGSIICSQPFQGTSYKKVLIYINNLTSTTLTYTYPVAFTNNPKLDFAYTGTVFPTSDATHITISATGGGGWITLEGY